jgi:hypothetical protein
MLGSRVTRGMAIIWAKWLDLNPIIVRVCQHPSFRLTALCDAQDPSSIARNARQVKDSGPCAVELLRLSAREPLEIVTAQA